VPLTPEWLYHLFAVTMLAVAAYSLGLIGLSLVSGHRAGMDVMLSHVAMGVAMAGMFVGGWSFGPATLWEVVFGLLLVWFAARGVLSVQRYGLHLPHTWVHALMSFAMLVMYWFPMGSALGRSVDMSMTSVSIGGHVDPAVPSLLALALLASGIFTLASPNKGGAVYGTHVVPQGGGLEDARPVPTDYLVNAPSSAGSLEAVVAAPRLVDVTHVIMCVAMGFMLVLML
jgi:hypothetical protein